MKAELVSDTITVKLTVTPKELELIVRGLGATSPRSRMNAGMSEEQADMVGQLFWAVADFVEERK